MPRATWRIIPARTMSLWLTTSASAGSSRSVGPGDGRDGSSEGPCLHEGTQCTVRASDAPAGRSLRRVRRPAVLPRHCSARPPWLHAAPDAIAMATKMTSPISSSLQPACAAFFVCASMHHGHCVMCAMPSAISSFVFDGSAPGCERLLIELEPGAVGVGRQLAHAAEHGLHVDSVERHGRPPRRADSACAVTERSGLVPCRRIGYTPAGPDSAYADLHPLP